MHSTGYASTGVKQILDMAGVPKGSFYHYFPSKEAFTVEVIQRYVANETALREPILLSSSEPPLQRLRAYFDAQTAIYERAKTLCGCLLGNLSIEVADHIPRLQSVLGETFVYWQGALAAVLSEAEARGELPASLKPSETSGFILNAWEGALVRMKAEQSLEPLRTFRHYIFDILLKK